MERRAVAGGLFGLWKGIDVSHHFDTPTGREDPRLNVCDVYLFPGTAHSTVMVMTVNPAATRDTVAPFRDEAIYAFHIDTDLDGRQDVSFAVGFSDVIHADPADPGAEHVQNYEVRRVARAGGAAVEEVVAAGATGASTPEGHEVRAFAGVVHDAFAGDAAALNAFKDAFARAQALMAEFQVPVVMEFILERVTNISMGTEVDSVNEFEDILCLDPSLSLRKSQEMGDVGPAPAKVLEPVK